MGRIYDVQIKDFSGGMTDEKRSQSANKYSLTKHFDAFTYPHKLVPHHKTIAKEFVDYKIKKFVYGPAVTGSRLFALGINASDTTNTKVGIYTFDIDNGFSGDWSTYPSNGQGSVLARNTDVFFYYKDCIFGWVAGTHVWKFFATAATALNETYQARTYTNVAQPVHHPADDIAYFFSDNLVHKLNDTSWTASALTLPSDQVIKCGAPYGDYLAIGTESLRTFDKRVTVYFWDRDSSLTTISAKVDCGEGALLHLANLNGRLIAVINQYANNSNSLSKGRVLIKEIIGGQAITRTTLFTDATGLVATATRFIDGQRLYFPMGLTLNGDTRLGIWAVNEAGQATLDFVEETATSYEGIYRTAGIWWIANSGDGSVNITDNSGLYSSTLSSTYESLIQNGGDSSQQKKLIGVTVTTEPLPTAGQIVLKYRKNEETSWTTIFTHTTDNSISHSAINIESSGATLPEYKELAFQVNSLGGAVVTGLKYRYEITGKDVY